VGDQWYDGVLHDLRFVVPLTSSALVSTTQVPPLQADALSVVYSDPQGTGLLAQIDVTFEDGSQQQLEMRDRPIETKEGRSVVRLPWDDPRRVKAVQVTSVEGLTLHGVALVNSQNGAFQSFVIAPRGQFELVHSGDVKIYENGTVLPRAFVVSDVQLAANAAAAVALMQAEGFDPARTVVVIGEGENSPSTSPSLIPVIVDYSPEHIAIDVNASQPGYLVLTDAYYPGWVATVDGRPVEIERADIMFRAVKVSAGQHRVEMSYQPQSFSLGLLISIGLVVIIGGVWLIMRRRNRSRVL